MCGCATQEEFPLPPSAHSAVHDGLLREAAGAISVAPVRAEAMSGFPKAKRPTEGKEEAREIMGACRPVAIA